LAEVGRADASSIVWMVYLGVFPTAVAFTTWAYALSRTTAGRMGATTYLVPPIAILLGWAMLGESPAALAFLGGALCLAGVVIARRPTPATIREPGRLAQLGEHQLDKLGVTGSSPVPPIENSCKSGISAV
jgi:drug/metabolite transporter (DMT)-like permease